VSERPIPEATVGRLPIYLRALVEIAEGGAGTISSEALAEAAGVNSAKVRKDLSHLGSYGTRGVGYDVAYLVHQIRRELGLTQHWPIVIAGIGNLGHALANYRGFAERGFRPAALVDNDLAALTMTNGTLEVLRSLIGGVDQADVKARLQELSAKGGDLGEKAALILSPRAKDPDWSKVMAEPGDAAAGERRFVPPRSGRGSARARR